MRRLTRRTRVIIAVVLAAILVGGGLAVAYLSPLLSVRDVQVTGTGALSRDDILAAAQVPMGKPLLRVDTGAIAGRVSLLPQVQSVTVEKDYPSAVRIEVSERIPVLRVKTQGQRIQVLDRLGVPYLIFDEASLPPEFAVLPFLEVAEPGPGDPSTLAAATVTASLPDWLAPQVTTVRASSPADIQLVLGGGPTVIWGNDERGEDKAEVLRHLIDIAGRDVTSINVSSPDSPAVVG